MPKINLIVGDRSGDGHGKREDFLIESNLDLVSLREAYDIGTKKVKFDLIKEVAFEYEDGRISKEKLSKLKELGFDYDLFDEEYSRESSTVSIVMTDEYVDLFLFICKLGNDKFEYEFVDQDSKDWHIGGYGLFY